MTNVSRSCLVAQCKLRSQCAPEPCERVLIEHVDVESSDAKAWRFAVAVAL
jgi:hypothetical protein